MPQAEEKICISCNELIIVFFKFTFTCHRCALS